MTMIDLSNKTIVVVGAGGRIGNEIVKSVLGCGANVLAVDQADIFLVDLSKEHEGNERFSVRVGDITKFDSIQDVLSFAVQKFGSLDGAVNTAYPRNSNYGRAFYDVSYEDFCENVSLHLGGYFLFAQQCAKYAFEKHIAFSLVNMSSIYGVIAPRFEVYEGTQMTMPVEYAAIKSALQHLVSYITAYTKGGGFRVNCVSPGGILAGQDDEFLKRYNKFCREKGMLDAVDIVGAVAFLLSDASRYICGQNLIVDDGFSI
ncbi:oxidoreductase [Stutzerimonas stutzeri]|uniref:oxidoreductase n=1 Tax=Stutzerimonas stutzeri TaxID=316 RepID=UPI001BCDD49E|nr:oxidoreductase [Stutzerimonas stutzeri]